VKDKRLFLFLPREQLHVAVKSIRHDDRVLRHIQDRARFRIFHGAPAVGLEGDREGAQRRELFIKRQPITRQRLRGTRAFGTHDFLALAVVGRGHMSFSFAVHDGILLRRALSGKKSVKKMRRYGNVLKNTV